MRRFAVGAVVVAAAACSTGGAASDAGASSSSGAGQDGGASSSSSSGSSSGSSGSSSSSTGGTGTLALGSAAPGDPHVDLADGAAVPIIAGPQGGYHIWLSTRVTGISPATAQAGTIARYAVTSESASIAGGQAYLSLQPSGADYVGTGGVMFFDWSIVAVGWSARGVHVTVTLEDTTGHALASATRDWSATCCTSTSRGGDGGSFGGDGGDGGVVGGHGTDCTSFCSYATQACGGGQAAMYATPEACALDCTAFSQAGIEGLGTGDTLQCRMSYARLTTSNSQQCPDLRRNIETFCVDGCSYYCAVMSQRCPGADFGEMNCMLACSTLLTTAGVRGQAVGDTLACRIHWAEIAIPDPVTHCRNARPGGDGGPCSGLADGG